MSFRVGAFLYFWCQIWGYSLFSVSEGDSPKTFLYSIANSPAFLMAVLKEEKLVVTLKGKSRAHEYQGSDEFMVAVNKSAQSDIELKAEVGTD